MYFRNLTKQTATEASNDKDEASSSTKSQTEQSEPNFPAHLSSSVDLDAVEFPPKIIPHPIAEYYNLEEFAVLTSAAPKPIENESKMKLLLSSACIAINNTNT